MADYGYTPITQQNLMPDLMSAYKPPNYNQEMNYNQSPAGAAVPAPGYNPIKDIGMAPGYTPPGSKDSGSNWWGDGTAKNPGFVMPAINAASGVAQGILGYKSLQLGQDQFNTSRGQFNRNLENEGKHYNAILENERSNQMRTNNMYDTSTPEGRAEFKTALDAYVKNNSINTTPV